MGNFDSFDREKNDYFQYQTSAYDSERLLYDSLISEQININGVDMVYYILSFDITYDKIWGEDNDRRYERCFAFKSLFELPKEDNNTTPFGLEPYDVVQMTVSKKHFEVASQFDAYGFRQPQLTAYKPKVGDIIKSQYANYYYEIVNVAHEEDLFLQSKHTWNFTCKPFKNEGYTTRASTLPFQDDNSFNSGNFKDIPLDNWW